MSSIRQIVSAVTVVACATSANGVSAQVSPPQAQSSAIFPDTPIGKLGQTLIEVINSGDSGTRVAFVTDHVSEAAIKDVPVADRVEWLTRVAEQSGGLEVLEATGSQPLEVHVKTRRGNHLARIYALPIRGRAIGWAITVRSRSAIRRSSKLIDGRNVAGRKRR